jgi:hypothetical protein
MGMFDSVYVTCPSCGDTVEFQSKAGECCLSNYSINSVPIEIAAALEGESKQCDCGEELTLWADILPRKVKMFVQIKDRD